jgi:hypothetical protein
MREVSLTVRSGYDKNDYFPRKPCPRFRREGRLGHRSFRISVLAVCAWPIAAGNPATGTAGYVAITYEMIHDTRVIPIGSIGHLPPSMRQFLGDSRGHWDGDTLVIDVRNFTGRMPYRGSSDALHLVEHNGAGDQLCVRVGQLLRQQGVVVLLATGRRGLVDQHRRGSRVRFGHAARDHHGSKPR